MGQGQFVIDPALSMHDPDEIIIGDNCKKSLAIFTPSYGNLPMNC